MKTIAKISVALVIFSGVVQATTEFRTPLSFRNDGSYHHWLGTVQSTVWYNTTNIPCLRECAEDPCEDKSRLQANIFSGAYYRSADKAFFNTESNKNTRKTTGLSSLFFGKESFRGEEIFVDGTVKNTGDNLGLLQRVNPFLGFARITPTFDYTERGAFIGGRVDYTFGCEKVWHVGGRASIPFKMIEIEQNPNIKAEETLDDVLQFRNVNLDEGANPNEIEFAARFDFLNTLVFNSNNAVIPFIRYNNVNPSTISIGGNNLTGATADEPGVASYAIKKGDGEFPDAPFRKASAQATSSVGANGELAENATGFFRTGNDYINNIACDRNAQAMLFIVPRALDNGTNLTPDAIAVKDNLVAIVSGNLIPQETALEFFRARGIDLSAHERVAALGDIEGEMYIGYGHRDNWYVDGLIGLRLPTGTDKDSNDSPYYMSTGHNKHTEVKLGVEAGWMPLCWMGLKVDASYHHAFKRSEQHSQAFKGATVKNIGTLVETDVSWDYFIGHFDWTVFHPWNTEIGATVGYEIFGKRKDNVSLKDSKTTTTTDLLGRTNQELDFDNLETRTNSMSHKVRGQVFHRWNLFEIFAGASHVFAGRNVMKESEAHIGFAIYF